MQLFSIIFRSGSIPSVPQFRDSRELLKGQYMNKSNEQIPSVIKPDNKSHDKSTQNDANNVSQMNVDGMIRYSKKGDYVKKWGVQLWV